MINTKKNIVWASLLGSLDLLSAALFITGELMQIHFMKFTGLLLLVVFAILIYKTKSRRPEKIWDLSENNYPLDMDHNDEREWRMMLTANYVSTRVTIVAALILLFLLGFLLEVIPQFSPIFILEMAILMPILVGQWSYVLAYFKLDK